MKQFILMILFSFGSISQVCAQSTNSNGFYDDIIVSKDIKMEETFENAKDNASDLLKQKPKIIKIEGAPLNFRSSHRSNAPIISQLNRNIDTSTKYGEAPFGLSWGATYNQTKALGVDMKKIEKKDSINNFIVTKLPKPISGFRQVFVSFGEDNSLWRLGAYGKLIDDDSKANKVMQLYRQYYKLLNRKYGNAKEYFSPKITVVEKKIRDQYGDEKVQTEKIASTIGGENFLSELQKGESVIYATFENQDVGAALAVNVDGNGKSYIIIDYTNLKIFREREAKMLDAL